jgi:hypothetical protein
MFTGFCSSPGATQLLAQVLGILPQKTLSGAGPKDIETNFNNASLQTLNSLKQQDKQPFLAACASLNEKLALLPKPGNLKVDDIVSAVTNQLNAALGLAKQAGGGYGQFEDRTREFLLSHVVGVENQHRNSLRPPKDTDGKPTEPEQLAETNLEFSTRYQAHQVRKLVGPPPDAFRISKSDKPDEYYLWGVYGLKRDPSTEFGKQIDGNIAAYCKADKTIKDLYAQYGTGTPRADQKIMDDPDGNFKRSPSDFRAYALNALKDAVTTLADATTSRVSDPASGDPKSAIIRSIALVESLRGAFGLADGQKDHSLGNLPRFPSDQDRQTFEAKFPNAMKTWDTVADTVRRDIAADPNADRSERTPGWKIGVKPEK